MNTRVTRAFMQVEEEICALLGYLLRSAEWWFRTDVSGEPFVPIFKGHVQDFLTLEDGKG